MTAWGDVVQVRPLDPTPAAKERALVIDSWRLSWSPHARPQLSAASASAVVEEYFRRAEVLVAVVPGVERLVCGWVARLGPGLIAYVYVVHHYRRQGIASRLLREAGIDPRGARWRYAFGTPRMRQLCRPDPRRPTRVPWRGVPHGQENRR